VASLFFVTPIITIAHGPASADPFITNLEKCACTAV
jgi:hypothetical protein